MQFTVHLTVTIHLQIYQRDWMIDLFVETFIALHYATAKNHVHIIEFIISHDGGIDFK